MNWMEFIVGLLDALAWPLVVIFCIVSLKKPITMLIPLAKKLKFHDLELEFGEKLKAVSKKAEGAFPELRTDKRTTLLASVENLPNSAVIEAWDIVDDAAERLILSRKSNVDLHIPTRYKVIENILVTENFIETKKGKLFSELRQLRNKVAHAENFQVGKAEARQYIELCFKLTDYLKELTN